MLKISELTGLWTRRLIAWPDGGRDESSRVTWLQGVADFADLRQAAWPDGFFTAPCRDALTLTDCGNLAAQQAFAGAFLQRGDCFEWVRVLDFQPPQPARDVGRLFWRDDLLIEEGVEAAYVEHWHRDPARSRAPSASVSLRARDDGRGARLLRVGDHFMFARDRSVRVAGPDLVTLVAGATSLHEARLLVDFEMSLGQISETGWRILRSTLPYREGAGFFAARDGTDGLAIADLAPDGAVFHADWEITGAQGDIAMLLATQTVMKSDAKVH